MEAHGAADLTVPCRNGDLARRDEAGDLGRRGPRRPLAPQTALRRHVDVVDEAGDPIDETGVVPVRRLQHPHARRHDVEDARPGSSAAIHSSHGTDRALRSAGWSFGS
jgi:hypothetical protein